MFNTKTIIRTKLADMKLAHSHLLYAVEDVKPFTQNELLSIMMDYFAFILQKI